MRKVLLTQSFSLGAGAAEAAVVPGRKALDGVREGWRGGVHGRYPDERQRCERRGGPEGGDGGVQQLPHLLQPPLQAGRLHQRHGGELSRLLCPCPRFCQITNTYLSTPQNTNTYLSTPQEYLLITKLQINT